MPRSSKWPHSAQDPQKQFNRLTTLRLMPSPHSLFAPRGALPPSYSSLNHSPMKINEKCRLGYGDLSCYP